MKTKPEKVKEATFQKAMRALPQMLSNYVAGDYPMLGDICHEMCVVDEYCGRLSRKLRLANEVFVSNYRSHVYSGMVALVIRDESGAYKFTRKDVVKFVRGEFIHGDSDNRDNKRMALHNFAFETNNEVTLEFAVTWAFVIFPGARSIHGNTDSHTPFLQEIDFGNRKIEVTQLESIVINAVNEYLQALFNGKIPWSKVSVTNDLDHFRAQLGQEIVDSLIKDWRELQIWGECSEISLTS